MNERIRELAREAGFYANPDVEKFEKFAELIVRECAEIATEQGNTAEHSFTATRAKWFRLGAIKSATMIKRTFGVEE